MRLASVAGRTAARPIRFESLPLVRAVCAALPRGLRAEQLVRPLATRVQLHKQDVARPEQAQKDEVIHLKRPKFGEQESAHAVLDLVDLYRPLLEHCDLAAAFFSVSRLSERRSAESLLAAEPRFSALVAAIRSQTEWRREDLAAVWRGTAYLRLRDAELHETLTVAAERKAANFGAREVANIFSGVPFIAPAASQLHGKLAKRATALAPQLSPKEIVSILHVLPQLQQLPSLPPLVLALCDAASASAPRFGAGEVSSALRAARLLKLARTSALTEAMLGRLPHVVLDMRVNDLRETLVALAYYSEADSALGERVKADLEFKRQRLPPPRNK